MLWGHRKGWSVKDSLQYHLPFTAVWADSGINAVDAHEEVLAGFPVLFSAFIQFANSEELLEQEEFSLCVSVTQDPVVSGLHETIGQDVQQPPLPAVPGSLLRLSAK